MKRFFAFLFFGSLAFAQAPGIDWQKTIGGANPDYLESVVKTSDGGYILGGTSSSNISGEKSENSKGGTDFWVVKTDSQGNINWQKTIGGEAGDSLQSITLATDGGYLLGGTSVSGATGDKTHDNRGYSDYWVVNIDDLGNIEWDKTIGGDLADDLFDVIQSADGGYLVSGISKSGISADKTETSRGSFDNWIVKLSATGEIEWQRTIGGSNLEFFPYISATNDGGYILGCHSMSNISGERTVATTSIEDAWVLKLDAEGQISWQKAYPAQDFRKIKQLSDGGYILAGSAASFWYLRTSLSYPFDSLIVKLDQNGEEVWHYRNSPVFGDCVVSDFVESGNGSIYFTTQAHGPMNLSAITKLGEDGNLIWNRHVLSLPDSNIINAIQEADDSGIIVGISSSGNIGGDKTENSRGGQDFWLVKFLPEALGINQQQQFFGIAPNPVNNFLDIRLTNLTDAKITIYNASGQIVSQKSINTPATSVDFQYPPGFYFVNLSSSSGQNQTVKIVKQ